MKNLICLFSILLVLISCAVKDADMGNERKIAVADQERGEEYYNNGQYTAALKHLLEAYKTIPNDPYLNNSLGLVYIAKKRNDLAETHFKKALDLKPDYIQAKNNLGATYLKQKKWELATQCFEEISENLLYATPEMPLSNLGWVYFHQKMYEKAKIYFEKSLEIRPNFLFAIHGLASIYIETARYAMARNFLNHALIKKPSAAILHSDLAKVYEALNELNKARKSWEVVLKLAPEISPLARQAEKRLFELSH